MKMAWATLIVGSLVGLLTGWRGGQLHQHSKHRVDAWRGAVEAVPVAWRGAVESTVKVVKYVGALLFLGGLALLLGWALGR